MKHHVMRNHIMGNHVRWGTAAVPMCIEAQVLFEYYA